MLNTISIQNFKSYADAIINLQPLTILIGANASGKSNALEAIRLLNWVAKGRRLDDIERSIQGGDTLFRGKSEDLFKNKESRIYLGCQVMHDKWMHTLSIGLHFVAEKLSLVYEEGLKGETSLYSTQGFEVNPHTETLDVIYDNFMQGSNKPHLTCSSQQALFYQLESSARFPSKHSKAQQSITSFAKSVREALRNVVFLDPRPSTMRDYTFKKDDEVREDCSNISSVLFKICADGETSKAELLNFIRSLPEQDISDISFIETERNDVMVRLHESFGNTEKIVDAPLLSDGTLRVLAIGAALLSAQEGALVIIEEVDNGVHPSRAKTLMTQIQTIASQRNLRVLLTSHNPALLDTVPDNALGDVLYCYRGAVEGDSKIVRLRNLNRFPELIAQGTLGQLATKRILERFVKDETTADQRKAVALAWLNDLKQEGATP